MHLTQQVDNFSAWAPASVENVFYQLLLKDIVNVNMQLTWNQDPLVLGHGELLANFLERIANHLEQGCELPSFVSQSTTET